MLSGSNKNSIAQTLYICLALIASIISFSVLALGAWDTARVKYGHVLARGLVLDDAGYPTYIEYAEDGTKIGGWSQGLSTAEGAYVLPAEHINNALASLTDLKSQYNDKLIILTREQYESQEFTTKMNKPIPKLTLSPSYKSIVVKPAESVLHSADAHVVQLARFDLTALSSVDSNAKSLLFDKSGKLLHSSVYNIAFDSSFFEGEKGDAPIPPVFERIKSNTYAPFDNAEVEAWINGYDYTDEEGSYAAHYNIVPCPCSSFVYDNVPLIMKHYYAGFTSRGRRPLFDAQMHQGVDFCSGYDACPIETTLTGAMAKVAIIGTYASASSPSLSPNNFYVDTGFVTGYATLAKQGPVTEYVYEQPNLDSEIHEYYDFDGDLKLDTAFMGNIVNGLFVCSDDATSAEYQGVFLSSLHESGTVYGNCSDDEPELTQPDILRLADHAPDFSHQGLVGQISKADLQDTDILVFRESTGMLLTQRKGINENELSKNLSYYGVEGGAFVFQMMIRGPATAFSIFTEKGAEGFSQFQSNANMNPSLHQRQSDHLKPGEAIRVILLNRKTGYIGSLRTTYIQGYQGGMVSFPMNSIQMSPPNLKISAERHFSFQEGMSASSSPQTKLIAYEGSAMSDDKLLTITTEWYDSDGTPLPDGMNDFGYTGRLAKVAGPDMLVSEGGNMDNFSIRPGKHIEHIRLKDMGNPADHFYIQVNGQSSHENPSFADGGAAPSGPLAQRPKHFVPFKVPVLDEAVTLEQEYIYKKLVADGLDEGVEKPKPLYRWVYRPELQFSTYDLKVKDIIRQRSDDLSSSIYQDDIPMIASSDNMVQLLYDLIESNEQALAFLGAGQELVFALGETEVKAVLGAGNQLVFTNLEHIAALDVEDFVTLSLYSNNDPTNVLWEYAFESVAVDTRWAGYDNIGEDGTIYVSADDPVVPVQSILLGYANRENKKPISMTWKVKGQGTVENVDLSFKEQGVFPADIRMSTIAGSRATPEAYIDNPDNVAKLDTIEVTPGKPANIHVELTGEAFIEGHKGIQVSVQAWDAHGNTVSDGTSVNFSLDGNAVFASSDDGITNGRASAFIQGVSMPDDFAKLTVNVGEVTKTVDFIVQPLNVEISDYPLNLEPQKNYPVTVTVTEPGGAPVSGVSVLFNANAGRFKDGIVQTAGNGQAIAQFYSGFNSVKNLTISARAGLIAALPQTAEIKPRSDTYSDTATTVVVGNELTNGLAEYERYDGARINLGYKTEAQIRVHGKPEQTVNLTLGSLSEPNLQPIAAFTMSELLGERVPETNGLHNGQATHVTIAHDDPTGSGKSYRFSREAALNPVDVWESSKVIVPLDASLKPQNSVGFRVDINASDVGGDIFTLEGGVQGLSLLDDGRLKYHVYTSAGQFSVTSAPITKANWQTVAGRYKDGNLQLEVNGALTQVAATGTLAYSMSQRGLTLGENFSGKLSSFKLYDWERAPLITFEDGSLTKSVTFAAGQAEDSVRVISTGQLNQEGESANSYRVGLQSNDSDAFVSVISKEYYGVLASMYVESVKPEGYPPIAHNGELYKKYIGIPFIASAHAGFGDWILENAYDTVIGIVGVLIPFGDFKIVGKQLYNLAYDRDEFDVFELTISSIGVLSVIPVAKALKPLSAGLRRVLGPMKGNSTKFFKSIGGVLTKVVDQAMEGRYDILLNSLPFLIIAAEMANDDEARKGLTVMINSIASSDDLLAWMDYLSLPADGWEGDEIPSVIDEEGNTGTALSMEQQAYPWAEMPFVGSAYAAKNFTVRRIAGLIFGKLLGKLAKDPDIIKDPQRLSSAIAMIVKNIKSNSSKEFRGYVFQRVFIIAAVKLVKVAKSTFKEMIKGSGDQRVRAPLLLGSIVYLEKELSEGRLFISEEENENRGSAIALRELYIRMFNPIKFFGRQQKYGAQFHLVMVAYKHLMSQADSSQPKVKAIEASRKIAFNSGTSYSREVDIVLINDAEEWLELKSLQMPLNKSLLNEWTSYPGRPKRGQHIHKEFFSDFLELKSNNQPSFQKLSWRFQQFVSQDKKYKGPKTTDLKKIQLAERLCKVPVAAKHDVEEKTGKEHAAHTKTCESLFYSMVGVQNTKAIMKDFLDNNLLEGMEDLINAVE